MSLSEEITILLVDNNQTRASLQKLLALQNDMRVVSAASNGVEAVELAKNLKPDILLMDIEIPKLDDFEVTRQIIEENSDSRVII